MICNLSILNSVYHILDVQYDRFMKKEIQKDGSKLKLIWREDVVQSVNQRCNNGMHGCLQ